MSFGRKEISGRLNTGIISGILFVFLFFSLIVKTKVDTYLFFIVPLAFIYISLVLHFIIEKVPKFSIVKGALAIALAYICLNPIWINTYLSPQNEERGIRIYNTKIYKELKYKLPPNVNTVMNMNEFEDIDVMFYNKGITAYHFTMTEQDFEEIKARKLPIAVFKPHGKYKFPKYVEDYPYLHILDLELKNF